MGCYVSGASPHFGVLTGFIRRIWAEYKIEKIVTLKNSVVLLEFDSMETRDTVMQRGFYHFDKKLLIAKPWHEGMQKEKVEQVPVWVQFSELNLKYWSLSALSKLTSIFGIPIMADKNTVEKNMGHYARVLIEMPIVDKLPTHIHFEDEAGIIQQ